MDIVDNVILAIEDRDNNLYRTYFNTSPIPQEEENQDFEMQIDMLFYKAMIIRNLY
jgi:hypothetical protein